MSEGYSPVNGAGKQRTDMHCHACSNSFIAELDYDVNGDHVVECPHCGHEHCRTIKDGVITNVRWEGRNSGNTVKVSERSVWKSSLIQAKTSSVSEFIRAAWMNGSETK